MHGVLGHDGRDPAELRARGRAELARYGVDVVTLEVHDAEVLDGAVRVRGVGRSELARTVLLATRMLDELPDVPGFADVWEPVDANQATTVDRVYAAGNR